MAAFSNTLLLAVAAFSLGVTADVIVWNTLVAFEPETIVGVAGPVPITDGIEFPLFPLGAFYDIDVQTDGIAMTLMDSSPASFLVFPDGVADIYIFDLGAEVETADLNGVAELNEFATVSVVAPMTTFSDVVDTFSMNITLPFTVTNGGLMVMLGTGSNYTNIGHKVTIDYTFKDISDEPVAPTTSAPVPMNPITENPIEDAPTAAPTSGSASPQVSFYVALSTVLISLKLFHFCMAY